MSEGTQSVRAQVRTTDGWPIADAVLTVTDMTGNQVAHVLADADGAVATDPLEPAAYTAIITAPGFEPVARTAVVSPSGPATLGVVPMARAGGVELPAAGPWMIDPIHSTINISVRHLGFASVSGRFAEFGGRIEVGTPVESSTVAATIVAASIDTGNKLRDDHLRSADFLDVDNQPEIAFTGHRIIADGPQRWLLDGELTLRSVRKAIQLELSYLGAGPDPWGGVRAAFHAVTDLRREDFGITYNQVLSAGISAIGATLRVELDLEAVQGDTLPTV
ncbi:MAG: YceI family protein [Sciscionella sp.]